jgi:hypothetical protein
VLSAADLLKQRKKFMFINSRPVIVIDKDEVNSCFFLFPFHQICKLDSMPMQMASCKLDSKPALANLTRAKTKANLSWHQRGDHQRHQRGILG